jgi:arylsulfatase A-like enzyme
VTIPEALGLNGYRTAAFSQNMLFSPKHNFDSFDEFYEIEDDYLVTRTERKKLGRLGSLGWKISRYMRKVKSARKTLEHMLNWVTANPDPFFLIANLTNAHYPWAPPLDILIRRAGLNSKLLLREEYHSLNPFHFNSGKKKITSTHRFVWQKFYDASILHLDREVNRFLWKLRKREAWAKTIIVITADHGELIGDFRDIVGHTLSLHDNLIHVPLMMSHPDYGGGLVIEGVVQVHDLYSSILGWSQSAVDNIPLAQLQRPSLSRAIERANDRKGFAFAEEDYTGSYDVLGGLLKVNPAMNPKKFPRKQIAVRSPTHKYIWRNDRSGEYYNLVADPWEERDLIDTDDPSERRTLKDLQLALETWRSNLELFPPQIVEDRTSADPEMRERLRMLGYL